MKKFDNTDKFIITIILIIVISTILVYKPFDFLNNTTESFYYDNGEDTFLVTRAVDANYDGWEIQLYSNDRAYIIDSLSNPKNIENITIEGNINTLLNDKKVYFTYDPEQQMNTDLLKAEYEVGKILTNVYLYNIKIDIGTLTPTKDLPLITCENATASSSVIVFTLGDEVSVKEENNCITLTGRNEKELIMTANRLTLTLLGIMK